MPLASQLFVITDWSAAQSARAEGPQNPPPLATTPPPPATIRQRLPHSRIPAARSAGGSAFIAPLLLNYSLSVVICNISGGCALGRRATTAI